MTSQTALKVAASTEVKIDKGVPMPTRHNRQRYPWHEMEVGDSFAYGSKHPLGGYAQARAASARYAPKVWQAKTINGVVRVWRTA